MLRTSEGDTEKSKVLGEAIICMIRHPYALDERYKVPRSTSREVLGILGWDKPSNQECQEPPSKRLC